MVRPSGHEPGEAGEQEADSLRVIHISMMFACCDKSLFQRFFSWFVHSNGGTEARPSKWPKWEVFQIRLILLAMTSFHPFPLQAVSYCISCGCTFLYVYNRLRLTAE